MKGRIGTSVRLVAAAMLAVSGCGGDEPEEYQARFLVEHNAADQDTGFQIFFDWDPWRTLTVTGPGGVVLEVEALGEMAGYGLTETFFETSEPPETEVPRDQVLALFPPGEYRFEAVSTEGDTLSVTATLTHDIPRGVDILAPADGALADPDQPLEIRWTAVDRSLAGAPIEIVAYRVVVARDLELPKPAGFSAPVFDAAVPGTVTSLPVSREFLRPGTPYQIEVLAVEASGNQTIAASTFATSGTPVDDLGEVPGPGPTELAAAKFLIEHNATDDDTGYQLFLDGEPWSLAGVQGAAGLVAVRPRGQLATFGLTEMFFETNEPEAAEFPLESVLALFPPGAYGFSADPVGGGAAMTGTATLSHAIPRPAGLTSPVAGAAVDATQPLEVAWSPVTTSLEGAPIQIVGYQLIVAKDVGDAPSAGFSTPTFSVHVPGDTTSVTVPAEFLEPGSRYGLEVLALEETGNQTISSMSLATR